MTKKNMFRVGAVLTACVMLLSSFSFAADAVAYYQENPISYSCTAGSASSSASNRYVYSSFTCYVTLDVGHQYYVGSNVKYGRVNNSGSGNGSASTSCDYINGHYAYADSEHTVDGWDGSLTDEYGST